MIGAPPTAERPLSNRDAAAALAQRDPALPMLRHALDGSLVCEVFGPSAVTRRVRYKPGVSIVLAVTAGDRHEWLAMYASRGKRDKSVANARRAGYAVGEIPGVTHGVRGVVWADRLLATPIARAERFAPGLRDEGAIMRHNPHRRVVVRLDDTVVKVPTAEPILYFSETELLRTGAPMLATERFPGGASRTTWWGEGSLSLDGPTDLSAAAGDALAQLHSVPLRSAARHALPDPLDAVAAIAIVAPALTAAARRVASQISLSETAAVVSHGDFTPDQVLVSSTDVRLIDFDRACPAPRERDLGSFAADTILRRAGAPLAAFHAAYVDRSGRGSVGVDALRSWTAWALLAKAIEPFRTLTPGWQRAMADAIAAAEQVFACR